MKRQLPVIEELSRRASPAITPQALAWHKGELWMGSRDLRRIYRLDPKRWVVCEEMEAPGIPWAAVSVGDDLWFTLGEGAEDDRYLRHFIPGSGFLETERIACPEFTGSYLGFDGDSLYLSQWYRHRILQFNGTGGVIRAIDVGAEICGHVFVEGVLYVLRGSEAGEESWCIARLDQRETAPEVEDLARVPFQCRSLTFDGDYFWTNHRSANETVSFALP